MAIAGKRINGGEVKEFISEGITKSFLKNVGFSGDTIYWLVFESVQEGA